MEQEFTEPRINRARVSLSELDPHFQACRRKGIVLAEADEQHEVFIFELKKAAEREAVSRIFGWNETLQYQLHQAEWQACQPTLMMNDGSPVGSVLLEAIDASSGNSSSGGHEPVERALHFSRFFLMPEWQGRGIGSAVLTGVVSLADSEGLPCQLQYLVGNPVAALYRRFGFVEASRDSQFVTMTRPSVSVV